MGPWPKNGDIKTLREMWIPDSSFSSARREDWEGQTFPSTPPPVSICPFLTTVGVSVSGMLLRVVRMRFWKKGEKRLDEGIPHPRGVYLGEYWKVRDRSLTKMLL